MEESTRDLREMAQMTTKETLKSRKILLVDDDQSIRLSLSYYFRNKVGAFMALESAEEALDHLKDEAYDIIICDYSLPGMDGLAFFKELNGHNYRVLKILVTAFGNLEIAVQAIRMGVHDFIMKPFQAATVEQSITGLIYKQGKEMAAILVDGKMLAGAEGKRLEQLEFLLGKTSHQINNTLQGLLGNAEMGLLEVREDGPLKIRFNNIVNGLEQVLHLSKDLTSISKTLKAKPEVFEIVLLMERCISKYDDLIKRYGIQVYKHFDKHVTVNTDRQYLYDIVDNLLINAIQGLYADNKIDKKLTILIEDIGITVHIRIIDNGTGIEPEIIEKVFQKGFTTKEEGNGMGLYMVERLAREIGATISLKSEKGKSTVAEIALPQSGREDQQ